MLRRFSLKPLWWTIFAGACLMPLVLRFMPLVPDDGQWILALLVAIVAPSLALRGSRFGVLQAVPFAMVGALAGVVLPMVVVGRLLEPVSGYYISHEAPEGDEILRIDETWRLAFGTGPSRSFAVLLRDLDGTVGGSWQAAPNWYDQPPAPGTYDIVFPFHARRDVIVWRAWPSSKDLLPLQPGSRHPVHPRHPRRGVRLRGTLTRRYFPRNFRTEIFGSFVGAR
ncbi:MAG: hypothetical protein QM704_18980 [Anaeromyxobacteraceae bacterium]